MTICGSSGESPCLLALIALLCGACAPDASQAPAEPAPAEAIVSATPAPVFAVPIPVTPQAIPNLTGWWERPEALVNLGLTAAEGTAMAPELRKLEQSYQTAQRQLHTVRLTQMQILQDPRIPSADIRRFNQRNLQFLLTSMLDQNIAARLWVREHLSAEQQARVLERSPQFFGLRWFRTARDPQPE